MIITLLRKPLEGTVAENVLKHGCGAINIDATRVGSEVMVSRAMGSLGVMHDDNWESKPVEPTESTGRWPANFILTHKEGCELKGTKKVEGNRKDSRPEGDGGRKDKSEWRLRPTSATKRGYSDENGKEEVADWDCVGGCPVKELDQQSGEIKSGGRSPKNYADSDSDRLVYGGFSGVAKEIQPSSGGASRFFKQFKKEDNHDRD